MSKEIGPFKLDPEKDYWDQTFGWVGHPNGGDDFADRRKDMTVIGGITDDEASYSYDDWALVLLDGQYYLFSTSGCSCPSPSETWRVEKGPATLQEIREHVNSGNYEGYTLPKRQHQDFMEVLDFAEKLK
jgi:hypothetical protein